MMKLRDVGLFSLYKIMKAKFLWDLIYLLKVIIELLLTKVQKLWMYKWTEIRRMLLFLIFDIFFINIFLKYILLFDF